MFSAIVISSTRPNSWCTKETGIARTVGSTAEPRKRTVPASARYTPARILIRVDLPAPFSPSSAWISPSRTSKSTLSRALLAPNALIIPETSRSGALTICSPPLPAVSYRADCCSAASKPDLDVNIAVVVAGNKLIFAAPLGVDIAFRNDVDGLDKVAGRLLVEGAVHLVERLPGL